MRLRQSGAAHQPGNAAHLDDIRLHHAHPDLNQIGERRQGVSLSPAETVMSSRCATSPIAFDLIMLDRLLEPPIAEFFEGAADRMAPPIE